MRKIISCMHVSLDGFVTGPKGEMDCFLVSDEMFDRAKKLTDASDTALYGRVTFEMMDAYWPEAGKAKNASKHDIEHSEWYNNVEKIVISKTLKDLHKDSTKVISENVVEEIIKLKNTSGKNIQIFGSPGLCHSLMESDLIDEYWLFQNPILLGNGKPMFKNIMERMKFKLLSSKEYTNGVVEMNYERVKEVNK